MGEVYRFRFRVKNVYGFGDYSDVAFITASEKPLQAQQPTFLSATDSSITLEFDLSIDNQGSPITGF